MMMKTEQRRGADQAFEALRQIARRPRPDVEHCELCAVELHSEHPHLVDSKQHKLLCTCDACAMLFSARAGAKYKRVPRDIRLLVGFRLADAEWDRLLIPINLAFFFRSSHSDDPRVNAFYPSPAGATESLLPLEAWNAIVQANPVLDQLEPDVEALLVNRVGVSRDVSAAEYFIVPVDSCYKLVGLIRLHWRGLSGGAEVWQRIGSFFSDLRSKAHVAV